MNSRAILAKIEVYLVIIMGLRIFSKTITPFCMLNSNTAHETKSKSIIE